MRIPLTAPATLVFTAWLGMITLVLAPAPASAEANWYPNPCTAKLAYSDSGNFVTYPARTAGCIVAFPLGLAGALLTGPLTGGMGGYVIALVTATGTQHVVGLPFYLMEEAAIRVKSPTQTLETPEEYLARTRKHAQTPDQEPAESSGGGND